MPRRMLTEALCEKVKPPRTGRQEWFDVVCGGLALRVTRAGHRSWRLHYRFGRTPRTYTIGTYPTVKLEEARRLGGTALDGLRAGIDPSAAKRAKREAGPAHEDAFAALAQDYLDQYARPNTGTGTYNETARVLNRDVIPKWRARPIAEITRGDVNKLVDAIAARGAPVQANRTLAHIRKVFNWAVAKGRLAVSPAAGVPLPSKERARDRVLSDDELRWLWAACDEIDWPFGPLVKLLALTAQRRNEVAGMRRSEIDFESSVWTIPRERAKNNRVHMVHLSASAVAALESLPREDGEDLVFTVTGETVVSGFSRAKRRLDAAMIRARRRALGLPEDDEAYRKALRLARGKPLPIELPDWTIHDLRRTAATGMARLNVPPHVVDKILNHVSGTIRGVAAVYNRFEYLDERKGALEAWGRYFRELVTPAPANVADLGAHRKRKAAS